jgi:ribosomal protein L11 methylase PrmA
VVLVLGCGLGLAGIAAAAAGARRVYLADLHAEACHLALHNATRCGVADRCVALPLDWRTDSPPAEVELLLAADILFERSEHASLERFLAERLGATIPIVLADPLRTPSREFLARPLAARLLHPHGARRVVLGERPHTIHLFANDAARASFPAPAPPAPAPCDATAVPPPPPAPPDRVSP